MRVSILSGTSYSAFKHREYRLFWIAAAFSNIGMWSLVYGRLWLMRTLTGSEVKPAPTDEYQKAFVGQVPMGRPGAPADIAAAVAFLASGDAAYINGQVIFVDGGYSAGKLSVSG